MRVLFIDCDTLRPDHLGCYGYPRNTSANIDSIAADGVHLEDYYCSDAPCLPSRAALMTGRFGFHTGIVGHGGTAADMRLDGPGRLMQDSSRRDNLPELMRSYGMYTASISSFSERHGAWWFNAGFNEVQNIGLMGAESAEAVTPLALEWLDRNSEKNDWFLHVHYWDPHTPHRAPAFVGNPFENQEAPQMSWMNEELLEKHLKKVGPHSANELGMFDDSTPDDKRQLGRIDTLEDFNQNIDNYDCGIYWMDQNIGFILDKLREQGIYDDMAIIISADHGETIGELGIYDEHATADYCTTRIPLIVKWPGGLMDNTAVTGLHYNVDLLPTLIELFEISPRMEKLPVPSHLARYKSTFPKPVYDGESFAGSLISDIQSGHPYLVVSQCAHVCQRSVRFKDWMYIRTYHDGFHLFDKEMLFNIKNDPQELNNVAMDNPDICCEAVYYLNEWYENNMSSQLKKSVIDPMWTVISEGGPFHARGRLGEYCQRLESTGRGWAVEELKKRHPEEC